MKNNQRLGQGLSGLIARNSLNVPNDQQEFLPTALLYPGQFQPRTYFSEESLKELASSIEKHGIIQPVIVRKKANDSGYEIIVGERRWRASKIAGLNSVPVIIRDLDDKKCLEISIIENIQRQDISPIEEGEAYSKLIDEFSYTHEELALIIGKSRSHLTNMIRLTCLPENIKTMINEKKLSMGHARALVNVEKSEDIARKIVSCGLNVRQTEKLIRDLHNQKKKNPKHKNHDISIIEDRISSKLGFDVKINDNNYKGTISIKYNSLAEFEMIIQTFANLKLHL